MHIFSRALDVVYSTSDIWVGLPYVLAAAGVFSGGIIVWALVIWALERCIFQKERSTYSVDTGVEVAGMKWRRPLTGLGMNMLHLFMLSLFFAGIVFIVWISASVAGLNPWTSAAATLTLGVVATYGLAGVLGHVSSTVTILATNSVAVGQHWEFLGMPEYDGFVHSIDKVSILMTRFNEQSSCTELVYMPMSNFTNTPRKRNFHKELHANQGIKTMDDKELPRNIVEEEKKLRFPVRAFNKFV
jgi:small-conductance mechanosensitive channel